MGEFFYRLLDDGTACVMGYEGSDPEVVIPETYCGAAVSTLYDHLFQGHGEIRSLQIPDTVTDLGEFLLDGCEALRTLRLPRSLRTLWGLTFVRSGLEELVLPDGLERIPPFAFKDCKALRRVVAGKGLAKVDAWAFQGCSLEEFVCGPEVQVHPQAFSAPA